MFIDVHEVLSKLNITILQLSKSVATTTLTLEVKAVKIECR